MRKPLLLLGLVFAAGISIAQNVGIGTNDPKSKLDINGSLSLREGPVLTLSNGGASGGVNDNISLPDITSGVKASFYRITGPTAAFTIYGIQPTSGADGQLVTLVNTTNNVMTIKNNASSTAANGFKTLTGSDMVSVAGNSSITIQYNKTDARWYVTGSQNYAVTTGSIATGDITTSNNAVVLTNNTGRLVGTSTLSVDVKNNDLNQKGLVAGPTGGNSNQVWGTDASGYPAWQKVNNNMLNSNSVTITPGTGLSGGGTVALGGSVTLTNTGDTNAGDDITTSTTAGGDLSGTYPNPTVAKIRGVNVTATAPTNGQVLKYNSGTTQWEPGTDVSSGGTITSISTNNGVTGGPITTSGTIGLTGNALALHNLSTGLTAITGSGTAANRTITGTAGRVTVANGNGVAGDPTIDLATVGTAGTYPKVTTDAYGRVTSGTTLSAGDIPSLSGTYVDLTNNQTAAGAKTWTGQGTFKSNGGVVNMEGTDHAYIQWYPDGAGAGRKAWTGYGGATDNNFTITNEISGADILLTPTSGSVRIPYLGTGFVKANASGQLSSSAITAGDLPSGSGSYIQNTTSQQASSNFNVSGSGVVGSTMTAASYLFPAPAGDPSPVITARTVPAGQGAANERTELILFHSNDPANGSGDDLITLRAPSIRFQTFDNAAVGDINNAAGSNDRVYIRYDGNVGIGTSSPSFKLHVPSGYIGTDYINTTDNVVSSGTVTGIIVKAGDNFHRTADAATIRTFLGITAPTGDNLGNHVATTTLNMNGSSIINATGLSFSNANPTISASSYFVAPGGAYFNSGTVYTEAAIQARGGLNNDGGNFGGDVQINENLRVAGAISCIQGNCPSNYAVRLTPNLHLNSGAGYGVILNWDNGTTGATQTFRIGNGAGSDVFYVYADGQAFTGNWWRSNGNSGWYSQSYGGGWWMTDGTYLRTYGDKQLYASGGIIASGTVSTTYGTAATIYANQNNVNGGGLMIADDGGFFDYNDAWVQFRGSTGLQLRSNSTTNIAYFHMGDVNGSGTSDKQVITSNGNWGYVGTSSNYWYRMNAGAFNTVSRREYKRDINPVQGSLAELVMNDLDRMKPSFYKFKDERDNWEEGHETKFRANAHFGLIVDETPDYIQSDEFGGIDIYSAATLGIFAGKYNRSEIKKIESAIGMDKGTKTIQDFGSATVTGNDKWVDFDLAFSQQLNGTLPVVSVTSTTEGVTFAVIEKNAKGFRVKASTNNNGTTFDYVALAKVTIDTVTKNNEPISPEVMKMLRVDQSEKDKVIKYWAEAPARLKAEEEKAKQEAQKVQAADKQRVALPEKYERPEQSPKHTPNDPSKAPGYNPVVKEVVDPNAPKQ